MGRSRLLALLQGAWHPDGYHGPLRYARPTQGIAVDPKRWIAAPGAVADLPPGQRQAIELLKLEELSLAEASSRTGQSVTALKVATHRAIQALRRRIVGDERT